MPTHKVHRSELRPLPMRITQLQFDRLQELRAGDGIAIQEHVRRALDLYLDKKDADFLRAAAQVAPAATPPAPDPRGARRLAGIRSQFHVNRR